MKVIIYLTIAYICIIILQVIYIKYTFKEANKQDPNAKFNRENEKKLIEHFKKIISERLNLLYSGKMNFNEWIKYNRENVFISYDKYKYYTFIWERLDNKTSLNRVTGDKLLYDLSWDDILKSNFEKMIYTKYTTDPNLINNFYESTKNGTFSKIKYYSIDRTTNKSIEKISIIARWYDKESGKTGTIGIGYNTEYLDNINSFYYLKELGYVYPIFLSILTLIMSILLYKFKNNKHPGYKAFLLLILSNIYLTHFFTKREIYGNNRMEEHKETSINSGILGVSFLVGVNVFILNALQKSLKKDLFTESGFIFALSLLLLLMATLKVTNFMSASDVLKNRLITQMIFNFAVILNTLIVINYMIYILSIKIKKINFNLS